MKLALDAAVQRQFGIVVKVVLNKHRADHEFARFLEENALAAHGYLSDYLKHHEKIID
jgi:hypothetical protein